MKAAPRISVILPVHNGAPYLVDAIESLLNQTFRDFEIIAIDDGSTDDTAEILARVSNERLRILRFPVNRGIVAALNAGIEASNSELIARMDADDICLPARLENKLRFWTSVPMSVSAELGRASSDHEIGCMDCPRAMNTFAFACSSVGEWTIPR